MILGSAGVIGFADRFIVVHRVKVGDHRPRARQALIGKVKRLGESLPGNRAAVVDQPRDERAIFCDQLLDGRGNVLGAYRAEAREPAQVEQGIVGGAGHNQPATTWLAVPARSAAARVFSSSIAMVIGPTPPGTGVIREAMRKDPGKVHVAGEFSVGSRLMPTSIDDRSAFHHACRDQPRPAGGGHEDIRLSRDGPQIGRPGVADGDSGVALHEQQRHRFADDVAAADDYRVLAVHLDALVIEQAHHAQRRARHKGRPPGDKEPNVDRMKPVDILFRGNRLGHPVGRNSARQGQLHEDPVDVRVAIERADLLDQLGLRYTVRQRDVLGAQTDFRARADLVSHVDLRRWVIAYLDDAQTGTHAAPHQGGNPLRHRPAQRARDGSAVNEGGVHDNSS